MEERFLSGVIWWPHSGGRWLCRSILKKHSLVSETAMVHPWIFNTTDMTLELDITAQVHKARSLPELSQHLKALKESTDYGRVQGLKNYFNQIQNSYELDDPLQTHVLGEVCMGSPIPKHPDMDSIYKAFPNFKTIHLVRNPIESFMSFKVRHEMDDDAAKVAGSWLSLNSRLRRFFEINTQYQKNYLLVRYEDLLETPEKEIRRICEFLNLPFENELMSSFTERWGKGTKPSISEIEKETIEQIAYSELKRYNYL
jgi:hypothetical protein